MWGIDQVMKIFATQLQIKLTLILVTGAVLGILTSACKKDESASATTEKETSSPQISLAQQQAENVIKNDPNVELVSVQGQKLHIQNKYTKRSMTLPFQMIIDGHYQMIQEDKTMAERILKIREGNRKNAPPTHLSMQLEGWGKTPAWIPRYPNLKLSPTKMHTPREDGSIWGQVSGTHQDSIETIRSNMVSKFEESGLKLTRKMAEKNRVYMIFDNSHTITDESQEQRKVSCTISKRGETTRLAIQYSYGM